MTSPSTVAASPDRTPLRAARAFRPSRFATLCLAIGAVSLIAPQVSAAPPPVTVNQPVKVEVVNPVDVVGTVETLDEALRQPYLRLMTGSFLAEDSLDLNFDIPAGKRLVIKNISVQVLVQPGQKAHVSLRMGADSLFLPVQSLGVFSGTLGSSIEHLVGCHPVELRVDGSDDIQPSFTIWAFRNGVGTAFFHASVAGYLVDL